jgi:hypothetical protein
MYQKHQKTCILEQILDHRNMHLGRGLAIPVLYIITFYQWKYKDGEGPICRWFLVAPVKIFKQIYHQKSPHIQQISPTKLNLFELPKKFTSKTTKEKKKSSQEFKKKTLRILKIDVGASASL